ncbi:MAG: endoflagellar hook capping protein [Leptospirales bacterium]|nr:endoflagellar hook capping protein [Leptospirales bacterium]
MPEVSQLSSDQLRNRYLNQDRQVNIQQTLREQEQLQQSGLQDIEVRESPKQLGKDDFLKLLITQLSHQDPTQPVQDQQFIAQMAQFSSLEQMQNMSSALNRMAERQGHTLVGRFVVGRDFVHGEQVSGVAQAFFYDESGIPFLKVGGRAVRVDDVILIGDPEQFRPEFGGTGAVSPSPAQSQPPGAANRTPQSGPANSGSASSPPAPPAPPIAATPTGDPELARRAAAGYESNLNPAPASQEPDSETVTPQAAGEQIQSSLPPESRQ